MPEVKLENDSWGYKNLNPTKSFQAPQCCQDSVAESLIVVTPGVQTSLKRSGRCTAEAATRVLLDMLGLELYGCKKVFPDHSSSRVFGPRFLGSGMCGFGFRSLDIWVLGCGLHDVLG